MANKTNKTIKTRIKNKYDTQENFSQATFTPLRGEILFYDVDGSLENRKMKVGDGETAIGDLPFFNPFNTAFIGTREAYTAAYAAGHIPVGTIVIITDEDDEDDSGITSSTLGQGVLGHLILG